MNAPSVDDVVALMKVLGVTFEELVLGDPAPVPQIPPAQRSEATMFLNAFLRAIGWLQPPKEKEKREMNSLRRHGGVDDRRR